MPKLMKTYILILFVKGKREKKAYVYWFSSNFLSKFTYHTKERYTLSAPTVGWIWIRMDREPLAWIRIRNLGKLKAGSGSGINHSGSTTLLRTQGDVLDFSRLMMVYLCVRYDPVELDPEVMCQMARENPQELANYSVSGSSQPKTSLEKDWTN